MPAPARRRDAAVTRLAILASARRAFARAGYDGAGVREIAAGAGVTAMLVNRYFGSKGNLFREVVAETMRETVILTEGNLQAPDIAASWAKSLVEVTSPGETPLDGFLIMLHSASSPSAAQIGRELVSGVQESTVAGRIEGAPDARERAGLFLALVAGLQVMRQMMELPSLAEADPAKLQSILTPILRALLDPGGSS